MAPKPVAARVLVVDDDPCERQSLSNIITALGHAVEPAEDGEQAVEKLGAGSYDAVVTDLVMPGMDGLALLRRLLELGDPTPVVVLTDSAALTKPFRSCTTIMRSGSWKNPPRPVCSRRCSIARFDSRAW